MNSPLEQVILGVVANGISTCINQIGRHAARSLTGKKLIEKFQKAEVSLEDLIKQAIEETSVNIEGSAPQRVEEICLFLQSPEVESIVRQLCSSRLAQSNSLKTIKEEFVALLALHVGTSEKTIRTYAHHLFDTLSNTSEMVLDKAIESGILSAHEAISSARHKLVVDELRNIEKNLQFLLSKQKPNIQEILKFEEKYRQQVASRHSSITPPNFDVARKIPVDEIYVGPNFIPSTKSQNEKTSTISLKDFLARVYRVVVLGNPGAGKSTLTIKISHDTASLPQRRMISGRLLTPIQVVLREFGAEKKSRKCSVLQFIESTAHSSYQLDAPSKGFEYLLLNGKVFVIFDGLDELLDTSFRHEVSGDIESFCNLYPSVPVLVTSREVGYEQAPLDPKKFDVYRITDFDEEQIREYSTKWFALDTDLSPDQRKKKADDFLQESQAASDIRSNPLMLALMCNIYRGESYIPKNRPDVYEKCAIMLFERWDKSRGIHALLPFEAHISPAMKYLAYWIYIEEKLQRGVTERELVAKTTEYLCPRRFDDKDEAEKAAREFIQYCKGRAWVFTEIGSTRDNEGIYQFTHRTFLEYFTASHLVRNYPTPETLAKVLFPRIAKREWDMVSQLAFQLLNKNVEGAGDKLLMKLMQRAMRERTQQKLNMLSFCSRSLQFLVPSPKVSKAIAKHCLNLFISRSATKMPRHPEQDRTKPLSDLLLATNENRPTITNTIKRLLEQNILRGSERQAIDALEITLHLTSFLHRVYERGYLDQETHSYWSNLTEEIYGDCQEKIKALTPKYIWLTIHEFFDCKLSISEYIKWHGIENLFVTDVRVLPRTYYFSPAEGLLYFSFSSWASEYEAKSKREFFLDQLSEVAGILLNTPPPWVSGSKELKYRRPEYFFESAWRDSEKEHDIPKPTSMTLLGAFLIMAASVELLIKKNKEVLADLKENRTPIFNFFRWSLIARLEQVSQDKIIEEFTSCGYNDEQQHFIKRWINREINLVK